VTPGFFAYKRSFGVVLPVIHLTKTQTDNPIFPSPVIAVCETIQRILDSDHRYSSRKSKSTQATSFCSYCTPEGSSLFFLPFSRLARAVPISSGQFRELTVFRPSHSSRSLGTNEYARRKRSAQETHQLHLKTTEERIPLCRSEWWGYFTISEANSEDSTRRQLFSCKKKKAARPGVTTQSSCVDRARGRNPTEIWCPAALRRRRPDHPDDRIMTLQGTRASTFMQLTNSTT
jgi:hypothetical protein